MKTLRKIRSSRVYAIENDLMGLFSSVQVGFHPVRLCVCDKNVSFWLAASLSSRMIHYEWYICLLAMTDAIDNIETYEIRSRTTSLCRCLEAILDLNFEKTFQSIFTHTSSTLPCLSPCRFKRKTQKKSSLFVPSTPSALRFTLNNLDNLFSKYGEKKERIEITRELIFHAYLIFLAMEKSSRKGSIFSCFILFTSGCNRLEHYYSNLDTIISLTVVIAVWNKTRHRHCLSRVVCPKRQWDGKFPVSAPSFQRRRKELNKDFDARRRIIHQDEGKEREKETGREAKLFSSEWINEREREKRKRNSDLNMHFSERAGDARRERREKEKKKRGTSVKSLECFENRSERDREREKQWQKRTCLESLSMQANKTTTVPSAAVAIR